MQPCQADGARQVWAQRSPGVVPRPAPATAALIGAGSLLPQRSRRSLSRPVSSGPRSELRARARRSRCGHAPRALLPPERRPRASSPPLPCCPPRKGSQSCSCSSGTSGSIVSPGRDAARRDATAAVTTCRDDDHQSKNDNAFCAVDSSARSASLVGRPIRRQCCCLDQGARWAAKSAMARPEERFVDCSQPALPSARGPRRLGIGPVTESRRSTFRR